MGARRLPGGTFRFGYNAWNGLYQLASVTNASGLVTAYAYDVMDRVTNVLLEEASVHALASVRYRFQGREWSVATGLINFRMRWYDPVTGRWLSKDPIGLSGGLNQYVFCANSPIQYIDPMGTVAVWMIGIRPNPEEWGDGDSNARSDDGDDKSCHRTSRPSGLTRRHAPSGNDYEGDPFGHDRKPGTNTPIDPHIHQYPPRGPKRIFNLDMTPRDGGSAIPERDIPVFERVLRDVLRTIKGLRMPLPLMIMPPQPIKLPDGRLVS